MGDAADDAVRRAEREQEEPIDVEAVEELEVDAEGAPSAELVIREERETMPAPQSVLPSPREWEATLAVAREIAATQFVPESYRGKPESVVAAILTGREMGIGPMQSMRQIHMIDGRPAFAADLMMAKMRQGGVVVLASEVTVERAYIKARRKDTGEEAEVEWTTADAEKAGLLGKKNWKTYPGDMLWARAVGRLARRLGSDLLGGLVYSKEEMEDWEDGGYGGAPGYDATTEREFDPGRDLLPGAISGEDADARMRISEALNGFDSTVDWGAFLAAVVQDHYAVATWRDLKDDSVRDFWCRMSNTVQWLTTHSEPGDFPPVSADLIVQAFEFAFASVGRFKVVYREAERPAKEEGTPLSEEQAKEIDASLAKGDDVEFPE